MSDWLQLLLGLGLLLGSAELVVRGSVFIALASGLRPMVVGLTVIAFGTSAPELVVSLAGALNHADGIAIGTVFGSNIANIGLVLGLAAMTTAISIDPASSRFELRVLLLATLVTLLPLLFGWKVGTLWGISFIGLLLIFTWRLLSERSSDSSAGGAGKAGSPITKGQVAVNILLLLAGLTGLFFGGRSLINTVHDLAQTMGLSNTAIAAILLAFGTSLPELVTSVVAAMRRQPEIALGNVIGSNIFNILLVLGSTACVSPLSIGWRGEGLHVLSGCALTLVVLGCLRLRGGIPRTMGVFLLLFYAGYLTATACLK